MVSEIPVNVRNVDELRLRSMALVNSLGANATPVILGRHEFRGVNDKPEVWRGAMADIIHYGELKYYGSQSALSVDPTEIIERRQLAEDKWGDITFHDVVSVTVLRLPGREEPAAVVEHIFKPRKKFLGLFLRRKALEYRAMLWPSADEAAKAISKRVINSHR